MRNSSSDSEFLSAAQVRARYGGRSHMWILRKQESDGFPAHVKFGGRLRFWRLSDLVAWGAEENRRTITRRVRAVMGRRTNAETAAIFGITLAQLKAGREAGDSFRVPRPKKPQQHPSRQKRKPPTAPTYTARQLRVRRTIQRHTAQESWDRERLRLESQARAARVAAYVESALSADRFDAAHDLPPRDLESSVLRLLAKEAHGQHCDAIAATLLDRFHRSQLFALSALFGAIQKDGKARGIDAATLRETPEGRCTLAAYGEPCGPFATMPRPERAAFATGVICRARIDRAAS